MSRKSVKISKMKIQYDIRRESFGFILLLIIVLSIIAIGFNLLTNRTEPLVNAVLLLSFVFGSVGMFIFLKKKSIRILSVITICYINFIVMPVFIFFGATTSASTPIWIAAGIMLMFLILDAADFWWLFILTVYLETYLYTRFYLWERRDTYVGSRMGFFILFLVAFIGTAFSLIAVLLMQERNFKISESAIDKSREIERSAGAAKSRFLANMSHEIRTPMNSIIGLSELILKEEMDDVTRNEVMLIKQSAYDLLDIIDDVLVYSKLDSGKMKLTEEEFEVVSFLKQIVGSISLASAQKDLKIHIDIDHKIPKTLKGDDMRLRQIITRILFISLSLTDNGRIMLKMSCERDPEDRIAHVKCIISDTGAGLSKADLDALFGVYDTYDSKQNSNLKGIGLKLNICRELLFLMNGTLDVSSIDGIGLRSELNVDFGIADPAPMISINETSGKKVLVYVYENRELAQWKSIMEGFRILPDYANSYFAFDKSLQKTDYDYIFIPDKIYPSVSNLIESYKCEEHTYIITNPDRTYGDFDRCRIIYHPVYSVTIADVLNNKWKAEDFEFKDDTQYDGSKAKILVVDDNGVNLKVASGIFKYYNIDIDIAKSGEEAIKKMQSIDYNLVFMDLVMPEMSGSEALRIIRGLNKPNISDVPVIALTANAGGNIREEILADGFQEYLAKPIKQRYLLNCLLEFLPPGLLKRVAKKQEKKEEIPVVKPEDNVLDVSKGRANIGNNTESYCAILNTYYSEGLRKIKALPDELEAGNIALFTTDVHGIKSSSAAIGATAVSAMFKELENAGKNNDLDFIHKKYNAYIDSFKKILSDVKDYLVSQNRFEYKEVTDERIKNLEVEELDAEGILVLRDLIDRMDLKACDPIMDDLGAHNYGEDINFQIEKLKKAYDMFDFHEVKVVLNELLENLKKVNAED